MRTDKYGGSIQNRGRFALELLDAVVEAVGAKKVAARFSPWSDFQDMKGIVVLPLICTLNLFDKYVS